jgi:NAD(P)H-hydrate epimerase
MSVPEAIVQCGIEETIFSEAVDADGFDALGIGPGLGQSEQTAIALISQLRRAQCPIVVDADGLNILSNHRAWMQQLPQGIILTPHPKELDRLEGHSADSFERLTKARNLAKRLRGYVVLKGRYTAICMPDGRVFFNPTGNAGMATAGSGDVLTGLITGLLARGYRPQDACILGVYLHGLAGDIAEDEMGEESMVASDIISSMGKAFKRIKE